MSLLLSCFACVAFAQATASPPTGVAHPAYVSPFADYRRFEAESPAKPWRQANDEVREAGGHVGILKGMSGPAAATAAGKSPAGGAASAAPPPRGSSSKPPAKPAQPEPANPHAGYSHGAPR